MYTSQGWAEMVGIHTNNRGLKVETGGDAYFKHEPHLRVPLSAFPKSRGLNDHVTSAFLLCVSQRRRVIAEESILFPLFLLGCRIQLLVLFLFNRSFVRIVLYL